VALGRAGFKQRYYQQKFKATDDSEMADLVKRIKQKYIEGLQWVFNYYYKGCPDWEWFYPFHYAPFASDLINCDTT
jgi:5'-3' exoribonuclease 2